jgi:hypothetical protein
MKDTHFAVVPKFLWDEIVEQHERQEFGRGVGRDHSHCSCCDACNDGGCGEGTHAHKEHCSWAEIHKIQKGVKFVHIKELLDGVAADGS